MDDLLEVLDSLEYRKKTNDSKASFEYLRKLEEINSNLQLLIKLILSNNNKKEVEGDSSLCLNVLEKGFVITNDIKKRNLHPNYFILELNNNEYLVTFMDTIQLLKLYFENYSDEEELINKMSKKLLNLFYFLKRNGLIYYDREKRRYKLVE